MSKIKRNSSKYLNPTEVYQEMDNVHYIKKQKRKQNTGITSNLQLKEIKPLTENQQRVFDIYNTKNIVCSGTCGSGKSFIALYLALNDILYQENGYYKIVIIKSLVKSREIGHLPGSILEKQDPFFAVYSDICSELFNRGDAIDILLKKDIIEFQNTSFLRGMTYNNTIIIVDEVQDCNFHEIDTICGRIGYNTKIIFCGDLKQDDLIYSRNDTSGFNKFLNIASIMNEIEVIDFTVNDIVRSGFVKSFILAKESIGI